MKLEEAKVWLYRVQQRLAITRSEAAALLALAALLLAGMVVRYVQGRPRAVPGTEQAAADPRFQQGAARLRAAQKEAAQKEKALPDRTPEAGTSAKAVRMNLNEASAKALERLPGVGPVIAGRIVAYRAAHGPFADVEDLESVSGIGPKTMARLAPLLFVATKKEKAGAVAAQ